LSKLSYSLSAQVNVGGEAIFKIQMLKLATALIAVSQATRLM